MSDIICLGEPLFELNQQSNGQYLPGHGGDTSNCAIAAARQGASVGYLTRIGNDPFGQSLQKLWCLENIDTSMVSISADAPTGLYFVTHGPNGHEFIYRRSGSAASQITPADLDHHNIAAARILHVSGISQAISANAADTVFQAIDLARSANVMVSYDTNLRTQLWSLDRARGVIHEGMSRCDIALPGLDDAQQLTQRKEPDDIADFYLRLGASIVALTLGTKGTLLATSEYRRRIASCPVSAVDATAAGDTFDGAFLAEFLRTSDPATAARYANAAAALSTQGYGAVAPIPLRKQVERFLSQLTP